MNRQLSMKSMYVCTMCFLALAFALVTVLPYVWVVQFYYEMISVGVVGLAWLFVLGWGVYLRVLAARTVDGEQNQHFRFLEATYAKHLLLGVLLLFWSSQFYMFEDFYGARLDMGDWTMILWIASSLLFAGYMILFDWKLLDSMLVSYKAWQAGQEPAPVIRARGLLTGWPFWTITSTNIFINLGGMGYVSLLLAAVIPVIVAVKWVVTLIILSRWSGPQSADSG